MKFNCGEDWKVTLLRLEIWHDHFALVPRRVANHDCRWLETIQRKGRFISGMGYSGWDWEYRARSEK